MAQTAHSGRTLRSSTVILGSMGALAAALSGCGSEPDKRCVDRDSYDAVRGYRVVSDSECAGTARGTQARKAGAMTRPTERGGGPRWYYGAEVDGRRADGGTFNKAAAVERGGFGCDDDDSDSSGTSGG